MTLADIEAFARCALDGPDDRPAWLRALRDADHPTSAYYRLLWLMGRAMAPLRAVEIGTFVGTSAAHLAAADARNYVVTVDVNPDAAVQAAKIGLPNLEAITDNSSRILDLLHDRPLFDLCYIDGEHNFNQAYGEYERCRALLRDGAVMLFDDVDLPMATREMQVFWEFVADPKLRLDALHHTGFGAALKDSTVAPLPWSAVVGEAQRRFAR